MGKYPKHTPDDIMLNKSAFETKKEYFQHSEEVSPRNGQESLSIDDYPAISSWQS